MPPSEVDIVGRERFVVAIRKAVRHLGDRCHGYYYAASTIGAAARFLSPETPDRGRSLYSPKNVNDVLGRELAGEVETIRVLSAKDGGLLRDALNGEIGFSEADRYSRLYRLKK